MFSKVSFLWFSGLQLNFHLWVLLFTCEVLLDHFLTNYLHVQMLEKNLQTDSLLIPTNPAFVQILNQQSFLIKMPNLKKFVYSLSTLKVERWRTWFILNLFFPLLRSFKTLKYLSTWQTFTAININIVWASVSIIIKFFKNFKLMHSFRTLTIFPTDIKYTITQVQQPTPNWENRRWLHSRSSKGAPSHVVM